MSTPSIQTLITQAQQVLNLKSSNEIRATLAAVLANANVGTPLNPNLTTQQLWDEFYEIVRQPSDDIMSIITDQMMRMVFSPPAPGGAGADKQVIFNDGGVLAGDAGLVYNKTTDALTVAGLVTAGSAAITGAATVTGAANLNGAVNLSTAGTATVTLGSTATYGVLVGSGTNAASIYINGATRPGFNAVLQFGAAEHQFYNSSLSSLIATLNTTALTIGNGNLVMGTSGKGIDFSATASGSGTMTSELLNDYEEGTFTPTMTASAGTLTTTTVNAASYTKIGRLVSVQVDISIVNIGTASGQLFFSLPFSQGTDTNVGVLRELGATGSNGQISYQSATTAYACFFGNGTLIVNGYRIRGTYTYTV